MYGSGVTMAVGEFDAAQIHLFQTLYTHKNTTHVIFKINIY